MPAIGLKSGGGVRTLRMSQLPESTSLPLFPDPAPAPVPTRGAAPNPAPQHIPHQPPRIPRWLVRAEMFLRILLKLYLGLAVCYAPWSKTFWDRNPLFMQFPSLSIYAASGAVRGIVSGIGLLTLWFTFQDAFRRGKNRD